MGGIVWPQSIKIPILPTTRQRIGLAASWKRELLFGGAAGGGKSVFLLLAALQYVDWPEYRALILRRTFPQLSIADGLLETASDWLGGQAAGIETVGGMPTQWIFPSGARLKFGHCQHLKDRENYQGGAWHYLGVDELVQFLEKQYVYIAFSRQRKAVKTTIPIRVRATSNPGGQGHRWVKSRFIDSAELVDSPDALVSSFRGFLPSKIRDNPHLDADDYESSLEQLHPHERKQLMSGDWLARPPGSLFKREWYRYFEVAPGTATKRLRYWDLAATEPEDSNDPDWSVGTLASSRVDSPVEFLIEDVERFQLEPGPLELRLIEVARRDGPEVVQVFEQEGGSAGKIASRAISKELEGFNVQFERPTGSKYVRAGPFASASHGGRVGCMAGAWLEPWLTELEGFTGDDQVDDHDDQVDSASGVYSRLALTGGVSWEDLYPSAASEETAPDA